MALPTPKELLDRTNAAQSTPAFKLPQTTISKIPSPEELLSRSVPTISQGPVSPLQKITSRLPEPVRTFGRNVKEGLLGTGQTVDLAGEEKFDTGLLGFFRPFGIGKPKAEKVTDRLDLLQPLVQQGSITQQRADEIATNAADRKPFQPAMELSKEEKKALRPVRVEEALDTIFGATDFFGVGFIRNFGRQAAERIAKTEIVEDIIKILKKEAPTLSNDQARILADSLRNVDNASDVENIIQRATAAARSFDNLQPELKRTLRESVPKKNLSDYESFKDLLDDTTPVFRGVPDGESAFVPRRTGDFNFPVAETAEDAARFGDNVIEGRLDPNARIKEIDQISSNPNEEIQQARREGYDAIKVADSKETIIVRPQAARSTEELRFEYDKTKNFPGQSAFSPNVLKAISNEDLSGPIMDTLRPRFPNIGDKTIGLFAERLTKIKRTPDIESHLRILEKVENDLASARDVKSAVRNFKNADKELEIKKAQTNLDTPIEKLLTNEQRQQYANNIGDIIKERKDAILAQHEYDLLWDEVGQKIFDRFEELQLRKSLLREMLDNDPAKEIAKYARNGRLPDVIGANAKSEFARRGDDIVTELGFASPERAQAALDARRASQESLRAITDEMRELRPKIQAAKFLRPLLEDVPVVIREDVSEIDRLATPENVNNYYKDITGFAGGARDIWRNFEHFFGKKHYATAKRLILDPFDDAKGAFVDEVTDLGNRLEKNILNKYGIKKGSKMDEAIQRYGDTGLPEAQRYNESDLQRIFGDKKAAQIKEADKWFRKEYNRLIDEVNETRRKIYPNDPNKLISKRKDYYRHFRELGEDFTGLYNLLFDVPSGIDPLLAGTSGRTKPKTKWLSFAQQRVGKQTDIGAIRGFIDYSSAFAYAKHIDPHIGNFRYLRRKVAETAVRPGTKDIDQNVLEGVNNFIEYLDDFANKLAEKTTPLDRWIQKRIPGGRKAMSVINWVSSRAKGNVIVGSPGSSVAQIFNVPQGIASAKTYSIPGIQRTVASIFEENRPMSQSTFIKERYAQSLNERFKIEWATNPTKRTAEEARAFGRWMLTALDEVGTKFIWNSHYAKAVAENADDPVRVADDITRRLVAGRGIGEVPIEQESKVFQLIAPFQIEVGNAWWVMQDFVKKKDFGALVTMLAAGYIMNEIAEDVRGSRVVYDPINALLEGSVVLTEELEEGNVKRGLSKFAGRQLGELLSNIPLGQTLAAGIPEKATQGAFGLEKRELFGEGDPGRFGPPILLMSSIADPLYRLLPPIGGNQIKKTKEAIEAMITGEVESKATGKVLYNVEPTPLNVLQAVLFGKYATQEAREFFNERDDLFQRLYRQDATRRESTLEAEKAWDDIKKLPDSESKKESLRAIAAEDPDKAERILDIAEAEAQGLSGNDRLIKMLGVSNGERAKYMVELLQKMEDASEKKEFLRDMAQKKLLSDTVLDQIEVLLSN